MKKLLRDFLINFISIYITTQYLPGLSYSGGFKSLAIGALVFMLINFLLVPLLKVLFLPLNLLTVGLFAWLINVIALYALTSIVSDFMLTPFYLSPANFLGITLPGMDLTAFWVAVLASFMIGVITHFLKWLVD